jgi:DMSO/TMAO reductase YedYZ molybdopterin-dependent catalytic subunit
MQKPLDRRTLLKLMGAVGAAAAFRPVLAQAQTPTADQVVAGKDPRLLVLSSRPVVLETPLELLGRLPTPKEFLFIRSNVDYPGGNTTAPLPVQNWQVRLEGLVQTPLTLSLEELKSLPQVEVDMVHQCSGNGRSFFQPRASGNPWQHGGMGQVRWKGVPLKLLLERAGVRPEARYVTGVAAVEGDMRPFEKSVPLADVLETALLALEMNGEPVPAIHGGPVRLVLPGYFGVNNVKWLVAVRLEEKESTNPFQLPSYRIPFRGNQTLPIQPGSAYDFTYENSRPNWRQNVKSVFLAPASGAQVRGPVRVEGLAWNDGLAPLVAVEVSWDGGRTWRRAELEKPASPYAYWRFRAVLALPRGEHTLLVRATDELGRSQPLNGNVYWNPRGYEWNGVDRVKVTVV